jgi:uncharacterized protein (UPF0332 family)
MSQLSQPPAELVQECRRLMDKARRALQSARRERSEGNYDFAASRGYYAAYYAMQAALLTKGITSSKHSGTLSEFGRTFLKDEVFPKRLGRLANQLFEERQIGDYESGLSISEEKSLADVDAATTIIDAIQGWLMDSGLLPKSG